MPDLSGQFTLPSSEDPAWGELEAAARRFIEGWVRGRGAAPPFSVGTLDALRSELGQIPAQNPAFPRPRSTELTVETTATDADGISRAFWQAAVTLLLNRPAWAAAFLKDHAPARFVAVIEDQLPVSSTLTLADYARIFTNAIKLRPDDWQAAASDAPIPRSRTLDPRGLDDARRIALLVARAFDPAFDGTPLGLPNADTDDQWDGPAFRGERQPADLRQQWLEKLERDCAQASETLRRHDPGWETRPGQQASSGVTSGNRDDSMAAAGLAALDVNYESREKRSEAASATGTRVVRDESVRGPGGLPLWRRTTEERREAYERQTHSWFQRRVGIKVLVAIAVIGVAIPAYWLSTRGNGAPRNQRPEVVFAKTTADLAARGRAAAEFFDREMQRVGTAEGLAEGARQAWARRLHVLLAMVAYADGLVEVLDSGEDAPGRLAANAKTFAAAVGLVPASAHPSDAATFAWVAIARARAVQTPVQAIRELHPAIDAIVTPLADDEWVLRYVAVDSPELDGALSTFFEVITEWRLAHKRLSLDLPGP